MGKVIHPTRGAVRKRASKRWDLLQKEGFASWTREEYVDFVEALSSFSDDASLAEKDREVARRIVDSARSRLAGDSLAPIAQELSTPEKLQQTLKQFSLKAIRLLRDFI